MKMKKSIDGVVAKVHVESFGSGTAIRALVALRAGRSYTDPRLREALELAMFCDHRPGMPAAAVLGNEPEQHGHRR